MAALSTSGYEGEALARILLDAARGDGVSRAGYPEGGRWRMSALHPKADNSGHVGMSALCQKPTYGSAVNFRSIR